MLLLHHCFISVLSPGCDPKIMGIGPVPASEAALAAAGKTVADMDVVEVSGCLYHGGWLGCDCVLLTTTAKKVTFIKFSDLQISQIIRP